MRRPSRKLSNSGAQARWRRVLNKVRFMIYVRHVSCEPISDSALLSQVLIPKLSASPSTSKPLPAPFIDGVSVVGVTTRPPPEDLDDQDLLWYTQSARFFRYLERGSPRDLENIQVLLDMDPRKNTRPPDDPERLLNAPNTQGERPLHVAARNNSPLLIRLLLGNRADPLLTIGNKGAQTTALEVAVRWKSKDALQYLLENVRWTQPQLSRAKEAAPTPEIRKMVGRYVKTKRSIFSCFSD